MTGFRKKTLNEIAEMICGTESENFIYRSSSKLTAFFEDCDMEIFRHDGSTRSWWVENVLKEVINQPSDNSVLPGQGFQTVIQVLMDLADHTENDSERHAALAELNKSLAREGLEAFYATDNLCYIRNVKTGEEGRPGPVVDRALSTDELDRRARLESYIDAASEDDLIENVILPLLQTLRFQRISVTGHRDKSMEFGNDLWMKYRLPTGHWIYFGLQVKRGKIDAKARTRNENVGEVYNQITMLLGHVIFDPDINKKRLVDHMIIVSGGEITKQAKHWLGQKLDDSQRSQILFMDRDDILHLFIVHNVPMPNLASVGVFDDDLPF